jgi:hypothetical protein
MVIPVLTLLLILAPYQPAANKQVSHAKKREFIEVLKKLPHKGELFTEEGVKKAGPYLPVLFALSERDIEGYDLYPFLALSRGLCSVRRHRGYAIRHFTAIRHPKLKLFWGPCFLIRGLHPQRLCASYATR